MENRNAMRDFQLRDCCPLIIFKSEYMFVRAILDLQKKAPGVMEVIGQVALPQLALIAYETSLWLERWSSEKLYSDFAELSKKRQLFKYFDDTKYTVDEFDQHCSDVLDCSRRMFKRNAGDLSFLQKDAGIYLLDGIEVGSTFTAFRYLYDDLLDEGGTVDYDGIKQKAGQVGFLIGQHTASLVGIMECFDVDDFVLDYTIPVLLASPHDFYYSNIKRVITSDGSDALSNGLLVILADAYYSLGLVKVFYARGIIDRLVATKFSLIALQHLKSAIDKVLAFSHKKGSKPLLSFRFEQCLAGLFDRKEKTLLRKCEPLRNTLVHYELPRDTDVSGSTLAEIAESIFDAMTFGSEQSWSELSESIICLGSDIRERLGELVGMKVWEDKELN
ncbi:hypothetical protein [Raoultibacter timonensis]|uniref:hypothetical protein n=1 Tax=Raoultibacter timonensis TaxID=1907662 RepID=UPI0011AF6578|nr:hypothetical protein [Raoultibacter timonensis]